MLILALMVFVPAAGLRWYQQRHLTQRLDRYQQHQQAIRVDRQEDADGNVLFAAPQLWSRYEVPARSQIMVETEYLTAAFDPRGCDATAAEVVIRYDPVDNPVAKEFRRRVTVPLRRGGQPTRVMFYAFWKKGWIQFTGLEMQAADAGCFTGLSRTEDLSGLDLALNVTFPPHWETYPLFQTITEWEPEATPPPALHYLSAPFSLRNVFFDRPLSTRDATVTHDPIASVQGPGWRLHGLPYAPTSYLLQYSDTDVTTSDVLVVEGEVRRGGISIGFLQDNKWAGYVNVVKPGPFMALLKPPRGGRVSVIVADAPTKALVESRTRLADLLRRTGIWGPPTDILIARIGWAAAASSRSAGVGQQSPY